MAFEDYTTGTEQDANNRLTVATNTITISALPRNEDVWVYFDKGVAFFSGDFEHLVTVKADSTGTANGIVNIWGISNLIDDSAGIITASGDQIRVRIRYDGLINLYETDGGTSYTDSFAGSQDTDYYLKISRVEADGAFGTAYCFIYSDSARTTLVDTLSVALHTSKKDYQYLWATQTHNDGGGGVFDGTVSNLDLQLVVELILSRPRTVMVLESNKRRVLIFENNTRNSLVLENNKRRVLRI